MQEIYRSFEGKLDVDCQDGYIILELKERYQIEWLSIWGKTNKIRVRKDLLPVEDFGNASKISELFTDISHGCLKGCMYYYKTRGIAMKKYWRFKGKTKVTTGRRMYKTND